MMVNWVRGLYYYYSTGATKSIPYFSTISALVLMIVLHLMQIGVILKRFFDISVSLFSMPDVHRGIKYLLLALYFAPIFVILLKVFPREKIAESHLSDIELRKNRNYFFVYAIANVLLLIGLLADKIKLK